MKEYVVTNDGGYCETFYNLTAAKKAMKEHAARGVIYKTWANGDFECVGVISLSGNNKTFVANTRQKIDNY